MRSVNSAIDLFHNKRNHLVFFFLFFLLEYLPTEGRLEPTYHLESLMRDKQGMKLRYKSLAESDDGSLIHLHKWLGSHLLFTPHLQ